MDLKRLMYCLDDLNETDRAFFIEMSAYLSEYIVSVSIGENGVVLSVDPKHEEAVLEKANLLKNMIKTQFFGRDSELQTTLIEDHSNTENLNANNVFELLIGRGDVIEISPGAYAYSGLFLKVFSYFILKIDAFAREHFRQTAERTLYVPALFPVEGYHKGGYFDTFPHHIMFATTMKNDVEILSAFARSGLNEPHLLNETKRPENILRTAACAPVYQILENRCLDTKESDAFFVSGKCYRNEGKNVKELSRLNEFFMKEYVFIGAPDDVVHCINSARKLWTEWIDLFSLNCVIETANDSFFASNYKKLKLFQLLGSSKIEFKLRIPHNEDYIACSSANFHRTHFTKKYNIRNADSSAFCHSTCFAFGIDRLTYSLLSQKGIDPSNWDEQTINEISRYVVL